MCELKKMKINFTIDKIVTFKIINKYIQKLDRIYLLGKVFKKKVKKSDLESTLLRTTALSPQKSGSVFFGHFFHFFFIFNKIGRHFDLCLGMFRLILVYYDILLAISPIFATFWANFDPFRSFGIHFSQFCTTLSLFWLFVVIFRYLFVQLRYY